MKVKDSPLYKTLCEAVRKEDHAELLRMLEMVDWYSARRLGWGGLAIRGLSVAFCWEASPQGYDYWCELHERLGLAGWDCY